MFAEAFTGDDPLLRHVRTRIKSPQTNGVIERFFGADKYEHLLRGLIEGGEALAVEVSGSGRSTTPSDPTRPWLIERHGAFTSTARRAEIWADAVVVNRWRKRPTRTAESGAANGPGTLRSPGSACYLVGDVDHDPVG